MRVEFGLTYPVFQAGMGLAAGPELAIAVSAAGGRGALGQSGVDPVNTGPRIAQVEAAANRPFAVNDLLSFDVTTLQIALDAGAPIVQFSWGIPPDDFVAAIRRAGAKMGIRICRAGRSSWSKPADAAILVDLTVGRRMPEGERARV